MKRSDWLMLLLGFKGEGKTPALDPVRVQKGMFLLAQEGGLPKEQQYKFRAHMYGPYSRPLRTDLDKAVAVGYVQERSVPGYSWKEYALTSGGLDYARHLLEETPSATAHKVAAIKRRVTGASFNQLLKDVCADYPAYAVNSVFRS